MIFANSHLRRVAASAAALAIGSLAPVMAAAQQPNGYPVTNVNLRAGPGTDYPVIVTVPARAPIAILGCLPDYGWCDSVFQGNRGWMRSIYLSGWYQGNYYALRDYAPRLGYRTVTFDIEGYWASNYRNRPFYGERTRWTRPREEGYVDTNVFYNRLSPHGNWTWIQGQYVWVPARVDRSWRPYTQGRWVYTNRGWTWASNEPFGWATYHYGRWGFSNRVGWFWVPGNRWAPAWVSWRQGDDHLAWAPLPPSYDGGINIDISIGNTVPDYYWQVVPSRAFLSVDLSREIVRDRDRYRPIIERTRPIGNTTITNNNVVVNNVVNVTYVEQQTQERVVERTIAVTDNPKEAGRVEGDAVEIYQPAVAEVSDPKELAPSEPKKIEDLAAESQTKDQGEGQPATDEMLVPPEVKKAEESEPQTGEGATPAGLPEALPEGEKTSGPPPEPETPPAAPVAAEDLTPAGPGADSDAPAQPATSQDGSPPPLPDGAAPPPPASEEAITPPPPPPADQEPKAAKPEGQDAGSDGLPPMVPMEDAPPPPPGQDAAPPPPPADDTPPPAPEKAEPKAAKPNGKGPAEEGLAPMVPMDDAPPPPPGASEDAAPPPAMDEPAAPPPTTDAPAAKPLKGKKAKDAPPPPPAMNEPAPPPRPAPEEAAPPPPPPPVKEMAPPPAPAPIDEPAPRPKKEGKPKDDKPKEGKAKEDQPKKGRGDDAGPPPPPPPMEEFAPPPAAEDVAPQPKKEGKGRKDNGGAPRPDGDGGNKPKKSKKDQGPACPEGTVPFEGGCAPIQ